MGIAAGIAKLQDWYTRKFIEIFHGPVERVETFNDDSNGTDVYWVDSGSALIGQAPPFTGRILLNKRRTNPLSDETVEFVYQHERGHLARRPEFRGLFYAMLIWGIVGITGVAIGISTFFGLGMFPWRLELTPVRATSCLLLILIFGIAFWVEELAADCYALRRLGEKKFLNAYQEIAEISSDALHNRIISTLLYPSPTTVIRVNRLFERSLLHL